MSVRRKSIAGLHGLGQPSDPRLDFLWRQPRITEARLLTDDGIGVKDLSAREGHTRCERLLRPLPGIEALIHSEPEIKTARWNFELQQSGRRMAFQRIPKSVAPPGVFGSQSNQVIIKQAALQKNGERILSRAFCK